MLTSHDEAKKPNDNHLINLTENFEFDEAKKPNDNHLITLTENFENELDIYRKRVTCGEDTISHHQDILNYVVFIYQKTNGFVGDAELIDEICSNAERRDANKYHVNLNEARLEALIKFDKINLKFDKINHTELARQKYMELCGFGDEYINAEMSSMIENHVKEMADLIEHKRYRNEFNTKLEAYLSSTDPVDINKSIELLELISFLSQEKTSIIDDTTEVIQEIYDKAKYILFGNHPDRLKLNKTKLFALLKLNNLTKACYDYLVLMEQHNDNFGNNFSGKIDNDMHQMMVRMLCEIACFDDQNRSFAIDGLKSIYSFLKSAPDLHPITNVASDLHKQIEAIAIENNETELLIDLLSVSKDVTYHIESMKKLASSSQEIRHIERIFQLALIICPPESDDDLYQTTIILAINCNQFDYAWTLFQESCLSELKFITDLNFLNSFIEVLGYHNCHEYVKALLEWTFSQLGHENEEFIKEQQNGMIDTAKLQLHVQTLRAIYHTAMRELSKFNNINKAYSLFQLIFHCGNANETTFTTMLIGMLRHNQSKALNILKCALRSLNESDIVEFRTNITNSARHDPYLMTIIVQLLFEATSDNKSKHTHKNTQNENESDTYDLILMSDPEPHSKPCQRTVALKLNPIKHGYDFCVTNEDNETIKGFIEWTALLPYAPITDEEILDNKENLLPILLNLPAVQHHVCKNSEEEYEYESEEEKEEDALSAPKNVFKNYLTEPVPTNWHQLSPELDKEYKARGYTIDDYCFMPMSNSRALPIPTKTTIELEIAQKNFKYNKEVISCKVFNYRITTPQQKMTDGYIKTDSFSGHYVIPDTNEALFKNEALLSALFNSRCIQQDLKELYKRARLDELNTRQYAASSVLFQPKPQVQKTTVPKTSMPTAARTNSMPS